MTDMNELFPGCIHVAELQPGFALGERTMIGNAMWGLGVQDNTYPHLKMMVRTSVDHTQWLLIGDVSQVTHEDVVQFIAETLSVNPTAVDAKVITTWLDHNGKLQLMHDNATVFGETVA